jgi:SAM-dependent methyltransferase
MTRGQISVMTVSPKIAANSACARGLLLKRSPLVHRIASHPRMYDAIQFITGAPAVAGIMRRWLASARGLVVDVGGGTGRIKALLPRDTRHVCVDVDGLKLGGYARKFADAVPLYGDATRLPLRSGIAEAVTFVAVSHHLTDDELDRALGEIARVQSPKATLFFFDAVLAPTRTLSRLLWQHDRGAYPRTAEQLVGHLEKYFRVVDRFEHTIWHRYVGCRCERRAWTTKRHRCVAGRVGCGHGRIPGDR